ncbi:hypothetical protein EJ08DRAFT_701754 [Tothia fuscella]|uniref:Uncharacterized protein n=1 Tax=Tothia fuscella TaxID=1048955 RepID=A0A9P4NHZ1_9PEZI|nr:hypothetical protein EJ08DRAFT_701754 [Tothia fuscella]
MPSANVAEFTGKSETGNPTFSIPATTENLTVSVEEEQAILTADTHPREYSWQPPELISPETIQLQARTVTLHHPISTDTIIKFINTSDPVWKELIELKDYLIESLMEQYVPGSRLTEEETVLVEARYYSVGEPREVINEDEEYGPWNYEYGYANEEEYIAEVFEKTGRIKRITAERQQEWKRNKKAKKVRRQVTKQMRNKKCGRYSTLKDYRRREIGCALESGDMESGIGVREHELAENDANLSMRDLLELWYHFAWKSGNAFEPTCFRDWIERNDYYGEKLLEEYRSSAQQILRLWCKRKGKYLPEFGLDSIIQKCSTVVGEEKTKDVEAIGKKQITSDGGDELEGHVNGMWKVYTNTPRNLHGSEYCEWCRA